jgi:hypothetical protein
MAFIEPYVITPRVGLHRYDARFRGYGLNKMMHLLYLGLIEHFQFLVLPDVFIITAQHPRSESENAFFKGDNLQWMQALKKPDYC